MIVRRAIPLLLAAAVVVLLVMMLGSSGKSYVVKMRLTDADGLRQGAPVAIGGQDVGTIKMSVAAGQVIVTMHIKPSHGPVGRDATASVASVNLLGQKRIELYKGNIKDPAPSGYTLPQRQVTVTPDLDQVIDVLTPDVRARLGILINEAGAALTGRRTDFATTLAQVPNDLHIGTQLLNGVSDDNHTLAALVQHSDGFVSQLQSQRAQLMTLVQTLGRSAVTVQTKRAQLAATLEKAPGTLATLQNFLVKLQNTTVPLRPAAVDIANTAPALEGTLSQLDPFRTAADPTLKEATAVAPELTRLATGATPVVRRATPVIAKFATFSGDLQPIAGILDKSSDNILAILENWSRAIEFRDGLSHVFRGEASVTPQSLTSYITQLEGSGMLPALSGRPATSGASGADRSAHRTPAASSSHARAGNSPSGRSPAASGSSTSSTPTATPAPSAAASATTSTSSQGSSGNGLGNLLGFLLGR